MTKQIIIGSTIINIEVTNTLPEGMEEYTPDFFAGFTLLVNPSVEFTGNDIKFYKGNDRYFIGIFQKGEVTLTNTEGTTPNVTFDDESAETSGSVYLEFESEAFLKTFILDGLQDSEEGAQQTGEKVIGPAGDFTSWTTTKMIYDWWDELLHNEEDLFNPENTAESVCYGKMESPDSEDRRGKNKHDPISYYAPYEWAQVDIETDSVDVNPQILTTWDRDLKNLYTTSDEAEQRFYPFFSEEMESPKAWLADLTDLNTGTLMFGECKSIQFFQSEDIGNLVYGDRMFEGAQNLITFRANPYSLEIGCRMFYNCDSIENVCGNFGKLENNIKMFFKDQDVPENTTLKVWSGELSSLECACCMFQNQKAFKRFRSEANNMLDSKNMFDGCCNIERICSDFKSLIHPNHILDNTTWYEIGKGYHPYRTEGDVGVPVDIEAVCSTESNPELHHSSNTDILIEDITEIRISDDIVLKAEEYISPVFEQPVQGDTKFYYTFSCDKRTTTTVDVNGLTTTTTVSQYYYGSASFRDHLCESPEYDPNNIPTELFCRSDLMKSKIAEFNDIVERGGFDIEATKDYNYIVDAADSKKSLHDISTGTTLKIGTSTVEEEKKYFSKLKASIKVPRKYDEHYCTIWSHSFNTEEGIQDVQYNLTITAEDGETAVSTYDSTNKCWYAHLKYGKKYEGVITADITWDNGQTDYTHHELSLPSYQKDENEVDKFLYDSSLNTWYGSLESLQNGAGLFENQTKVGNLMIDLCSLTNGWHMFYNCAITLDGLQSITYGSGREGANWHKVYHEDGSYEIDYSSGGIADVNALKSTEDMDVSHWDDTTVYRRIHITMDYSDFEKSDPDGLHHSTDSRFYKYCKELQDRGWWTDITYTHAIDAKLTATRTTIQLNENDFSSLFVPKVTATEEIKEIKYYISLDGGEWTYFGDGESFIVLDRVYNENHTYTIRADITMESGLEGTLYYTDVFIEYKTDVWTPQFDYWVNGSVNIDGLEPDAEEFSADFTPFVQLIDKKLWNKIEYRYKTAVFHIYDSPNTEKVLFTETGEDWDQKYNLTIDIADMMSNGVLVEDNYVRSILTKEGLVPDTFYRYKSHVDFDITASVDFDNTIEGYAEKFVYGFGAATNNNTITKTFPVNPDGDIVISEGDDYNTPDRYTLNSVKYKVNQSNYKSLPTCNKLLLGVFDYSDDGKMGRLLCHSNVFDLRDLNKWSLSEYRFDGEIITVNDREYEFYSVLPDGAILDGGRIYDKGTNNILPVESKRLKLTDGMEVSKEDDTYVYSEDDGKFHKKSDTSVILPNNQVVTMDEEQYRYLTKYEWLFLDSQIVPMIKGRSVQYKTMNYCGDNSSPSVPLNVLEDGAKVEKDGEEYRYHKGSGTFYKENGITLVDGDVGTLDGGSKQLTYTDSLKMLISPSEKLTLVTANGVRLGDGNSVYYYVERTEGGETIKEFVSDNTAYCKWNEANCSHVLINGVQYTYYASTGTFDREGESIPRSQVNEFIRLNEKTSEMDTKLRDVTYFKPWGSLNMWFDKNATIPVHEGLLITRGGTPYVYHNGEWVRVYQATGNSVFVTNGKRFVYSVNTSERGLIEFKFDQSIKFDKGTIYRYVFLDGCLDEATLAGLTFKQCKQYERGIYINCYQTAGSIPSHWGTFGTNTFGDGGWHNKYLPTFSFDITAEDGQRYLVCNINAPKAFISAVKEEDSKTTYLIIPSTGSLSKDFTYHLVFNGLIYLDTTQMEFPPTPEPVEPGPPEPSPYHPGPVTPVIPPTENTDEEGNVIPWWINPINPTKKVSHTGTYLIGQYVTDISEHIEPVEPPYYYIVQEVSYPGMTSYTEEGTLFVDVTLTTRLYPESQEYCGPRDGQPANEPAGLSMQYTTDWAGSTVRVHYHSTQGSQATGGATQTFGMPTGLRDVIDVKWEDWTWKTFYARGILSSISTASPWTFKNTGAIKSGKTWGIVNGTQYNIHYKFDVVSVSWNQYIAETIAKSLATKQGSGDGLVSVLVSPQGRTYTNTNSDVTPPSVDLEQQVKTTVWFPFPASRQWDTNCGHPEIGNGGNLGGLFAENLYAYPQGDTLEIPISFIAVGSEWWECPEGANNYTRAFGLPPSDENGTRTVLVRRVL